MSSVATRDWIEANQRHLAAAVASVRSALEGHVARVRGASAPSSESKPEPETGTETEQRPSGAAPDSASWDLSAPAALDKLCATFGLSPFERDVLLLCAGIELDATFAPLCAAAQGDAQRPYPTFSLALAALPGAHWSALTPAAPLRHWRLVEVGAGAALTTSPLRIDERVLHHLAGASHPDERLAGLITAVQPTEDPVPSHRALADALAAAWLRATGSPPLPVAQLCGDESVSRQAIAAAACATLGLSLSVMPAEALPTAPGDLEALLRLWEREAALDGCALLLDCDDLDASDTARNGPVRRAIERLRAPLIVASRERRGMPQRPEITLEVGMPSASEQRIVWQGALGAAAPKLNGHVEALVGQFHLNASAIRAASVAALGYAAQEPRDDDDDLGSLLWDACRAQARPRLDDLAQRIEPAAEWDDLVLPEPQRLTLREIAAHVRQRAIVYEVWGFGARGARGLGISALFAGASGTGKTLAAEVLARALRLDLYRIDLSSVVSKYIGETEKNLRRVFDAAEEGGAILLFDEADALFGKRSEVKDSHDRYANIEVSYLLQRMEAYRGLAILTSNLKSALDTAFLRRIRFIVQFPFPDAAQRAEIWRRIFPSATPTDGLNLGKLAQLNIAGGNIRNIALNAAFLAADAGEPVGMPHLLRAARTEYAKIEKPLTEAEIAGWG